MRRLFAALLGIGLAAPAAGVITVSNDASEILAPADDPGFANVGVRGSQSAVYLGDGWVLTAAHVGAGDVELDGRIYPALPGSSVTLVTEETSGSTAADLVLFQLAEEPDLPGLALARSAPSLGTPLVMIGHGRKRGAEASWNGLRGWSWGADHELRWGTNRIDRVDLTLPSSGTRTHAFQTGFDPDAGPHEAQASGGDSGGAVFALGEDGWELVGVVLAVGPAFWPPELALFGGVTLSADLSAYRREIQDVLGLAPALVLDAPFQDFGDQPIGGETVAAIAVRNLGSAELTLHRIGLSGSPALSLHLPQLVPERLAPGAQLDLELRFAPRAPGDAQAVFWIDSDDPDQGRHELSFTGRALAPQASCARVKRLRRRVRSDHRGADRAREFRGKRRPERLDDRARFEDELCVLVRRGLSTADSDSDSAR